MQAKHCALEGIVKVEHRYIIQNQLSYLSICEFLTFFAILLIHHDHIHSTFPPFLPAPPNLHSPDPLFHHFTLEKFRTLRDIKD